MNLQDIQTIHTLHADHVARYERPKVVEGMTTQVPNIFDRALIMLRSALSKHPAPRSSSIAIQREIRRA